MEVFSQLEPASCHAASTELRVERMLPAEIIQIRKTRTIPVLRCLAVVTEVSQYCGHSSAAGVMRFLKFRETAKNHKPAGTPSATKENWRSEAGSTQQS